MYKLSTLITVSTLDEVKELKSKGWYRYGNETINNSKAGYTMKLEYVSDTVPMKNLK